MGTCHRLRVEHLADPLGIDEPVPMFGWQLAGHAAHAADAGADGRDRGRAPRGAGESARSAGPVDHEARQTAYRILASRTAEACACGIGDRWDSGWVRSGRSHLVSWGGGSLASGERVWWSVRCRDDSGEEYASERPGFFSMGLLDPSDWKASWIGAADGVGAPMFRKELRLEVAPVRATAYVSGLGYYELRINGGKVGDRVLEPNWTNFDNRELHDLLYPHDDRSRTRVLYAVHDVTGLLRSGQNALGVMLGNGWYNQRERTVEGKLWYGWPRFILQVDIECTDESRTVIVSDQSWRWAPSEIESNGIFSGEVVDARKARKGWDAPGFPEGDWQRARLARQPSGRLCAQLSPPDRIVGELLPQRMSEPSPGLFVFDVGRNISGWVRLAAEGPSGTRISLRFGEELDDRGLPSVVSFGEPCEVQQDQYTLRGGDLESWEPRFSWHGFRYVEVTGWPGRPPAAAIVGREVHSDIASTGEFHCSEPLVNGIQELCRRSLLANLHGSVPSDCPHRERLGYTGDGQLTVETALYNFDAYRLYAKWVDDMADAQHPDTGMVPHTAPFFGGGGGPAWGSAYLIVPWALYRFSGDRRILERHYDGMRAWLAYLGSCTNDGAIVVREEPGCWCLGDWCVPKMDGDDEAKVPEPLVNTWVYARCARVLSRVARALGKSEDEKSYRRLADDIARAFHDRFFDTSRGFWSIGRHGTEAFGLTIGSVSEQMRSMGFAHLVETVSVRNGGHLDTGILGTPALLDALAEAGRVDLALGMLLKRSYPGYGHWIERGATTLWETWDGSGSHNHHMFASVSAWFFRVLAGIAPDPAMPGFERTIVRPYATSGLSLVDAKIETAYGRLGVSWRRTGAGLHLEVEVPPNAEALIYVPRDDGGRSWEPPVTAGSGRHVWEA